jgi:hypothetical protein
VSVRSSSLRDGIRRSHKKQTGGEAIQSTGVGSRTAIACGKETERDTSSICLMPARCRTGCGKISKRLGRLGGRRERLSAARRQRWRADRFPLVASHVCDLVDPLAVSFPQKNHHRNEGVLQASKTQCLTLFSWFRSQKFRQAIKNECST